MATFLKIKKSTDADTAYGTSLTGAKGSTVVKAKADTYTGRSARSNTVKVVSKDDATVNASAVITQSGSTVFKFKDSGTLTETATTVAAGAKVTKTIITNAPSIAVAEVKDASHQSTGCTIAVKYNNTAITASAGKYTVPSDPGASGQFEIVVEVTTPANPDANTIPHKINITAEGATGTAILTITQAQANPTLSITPTTATIAAAGGTTDLTISSNDEWTASVVE